MVSVYIHPTVDKIKARTVVGTESVSLKFSDGVSEITICGDNSTVEAFRMIADIFNDAFASNQRGE